MALFQNSVLRENLKNLDLNPIQSAYEKYKTDFLTKIGNIKKSKEEQYQYGFLDDLFVKVLGFTLNPSPDFNLTTEFKNQSDSKKADGAILKDGKVIAVIELKSTKTKSMDSIVNQAFNYKNNHPTCRYIITSNFQKLRLYIDHSDNYEEFDLFKLDFERFTLLYYLFCSDNILSGLALKLKEQSKLKEQDISNELYKKYAGLRTNLFENIVKNNPHIDKLTLLTKTQTLLDRMVFIFFAEDRGILPTNTIATIIEHYKNDIEDRPLYHFYKIYFRAINEGNSKINITEYNGGLFAEDEMLNSLIIDDAVLDACPLALSAYDFNTDVDVNILGHIFENSLSDIEEMKANIENQEFDKTKTKRKKDGVFYTPEYITKYIVDNTLGKLCFDKKVELELDNIEINIPKHPKKLNKGETKLKDALDAYREYLLNLKILDPACGSGAFLNQALNFLLDEHDFIDESIKILMGGNVLGLYDVKKGILENNLYGVDINSEAVEIAKLSLWLRTVEHGRKLNILSGKIKVGNSLIDDRSVVEDAFVWEEEFAEVFEQGGFDVVIGNPPYVNIANILNDEYREWLKNNFKTAKNKSDLYSFFTEKSIFLLNKKGLLGFITSNSWLSIDSFSKFRKFLLDEVVLLKLVELPNDVFQDAVVTPIIFILQNRIVSHNYCINLVKYKNNSYHNLDYELKSSDILNRNNYTISLNKNITLKNNITILKDIANFSLGIKTSNDKRFILQKKIDDLCYPMLRGRNISKYTHEDPVEYIWYKPKLMLEKRGAGVRKLEYFITPKIIIQEIAKEINASFDENNYLVNDTVNVIYLLDNKYMFKYILALLNSKLINFWFKNTYTSGLHIKINQLHQIPISITTVENQILLSNKADSMLDLNKTFQTKKDKFLSRINSNFDIDKLSKKLEAFYESDFKTFLKELKKKKVTLSLKEQDEWEEYFESYQKELLEIKAEIDKTDREIDEMVYGLYGLSEDEINTIEKKN